MKGISYLYCFLAVFLFSTNELVGKLIGDGISPGMITIIRFFIGSLIIIPFIFLQKRKSSEKYELFDLFRMSIPGILNVAGAMFFLQLAIYYGKASTSAILISSNPLFVAILASLILKEPLSRAKVIGIILGLLGMFLVVKGENLHELTAINSNLGLFYGIIASFAFGLYTVLAKREVAKYGNLVFNAVSFAAGAFILLIISLIIGIDLSFELTGKNLLAISYLSVFITGVAYVMFFTGLKNIPTANGSMIFFLKPFIASFLSYLILDERITTLQIVGVILIFLGILASQSRNESREKRVAR